MCESRCLEVVVVLPGGPNLYTLTSPVLSPTTTEGVVLENMVQRRREDARFGRGMEEWEVRVGRLRIRIDLGRRRAQRGREGWRETGGGRGS